MIPTVDNYFASRFKKILDAILRSVSDKDSEFYVIDDVLQGYSKEQRDKFKKSFCYYDGKSQNSIDVNYTYPNVTGQANALYVVSRGSSDENTGSIGNIMADTTDFGRQANGENTISDEQVIIKADEKGSYAVTKYPILEMVSVKEADATVIDYDNFESGSNKFRFTDIVDDGFIGYPFHVTYIAKDTGSHKDYTAKSVGYELHEHLDISAISNNVDTVRELDSLLKYILILMRDKGMESNYFQSPKLSSEPLGTLNLGSNGADSPVYVINTSIEYTTSYIISKDSATRIKDIMLKLEPDNTEVENG